MIGKVLTSPKAKLTGTRLAKILGISCGLNLDYQEPRYDFIIRYGNTTEEIPYSAKVINQKNAIIRSSNKLQSRLDLIRHDIPVPRLYKCIEEIDNYPIIARPPYHFKGRDFNLIHNKTDARNYLDRGYYLQKYIDKKNEFRIFVWHDKIFEVNSKEPRKEYYNDMIRNFGNGWRFKWLRLDDVPSKMRKYCRVATEIMGLDFSGIDCCIDKEDNIYIFEINSAPSLIQRKAEKLAEKIKEYFNNQSLNNRNDGNASAPPMEYIRPDRPRRVTFDDIVHRDGI